MTTLSMIGGDSSDCDEETIIRRKAPVPSSSIDP